MESPGSMGGDVEFRWYTQTVTEPVPSRLTTVINVTSFATEAALIK